MSQRGTPRGIVASGGFISSETPAPREVAVGGPIEYCSSWPTTTRYVPGIVLMMQI